MSAVASYTSAGCWVRVKVKPIRITSYAEFVTAGVKYLSAVSVFKMKLPKSKVKSIKQSDRPQRRQTVAVRTPAVKISLQRWRWWSSRNCCWTANAQLLSNCGLSAAHLLVKQQWRPCLWHAGFFCGAPNKFYETTKLYSEA